MDYDTLLNTLADNELAYMGLYLCGRKRWGSRAEVIAAVLDAHEHLRDADPRSGFLFRYFGMPSMGTLVARGMV